VSYNFPVSIDASLRDTETSVISVNTKNGTL